MPPVHDPMFFENILWPFKVTGAIVLAFIIHEWLGDVINNDDEDPDGFA